MVIRRILALAAVVVVVGQGVPARAASPAWGPFASSGAGLRKQSVTVGVPAGWKLLLDGRDPRYVDTVVVPQGFYSQDTPDTVTFTPEIGFLGRAAPVTVRVDGPGGRSKVSTYVATVTLPPPPATPDRVTSGRAHIPQQVDFDLPPGGSHGYVDQGGHDVVPKVPQGEFKLAAISGVAAVPGKPFDPTLIAARGFLIFEPGRGVSGRVDGVRYRITDAYGQTSIGRWTPVVKGY